MVNNNTNPGIMKRKRVLKSRASKNQRKESICGLSVLIRGTSCFKGVCVCVCVLAGEGSSRAELTL